MNADTHTYDPQSEEGAGSNSKSIDVLLVEDSPDDAALIELELENAGYDVHLTRVESAAELEKSLNSQNWDVLISDYNLPGFDGLTALNTVRQMDIYIPFILVSGTVGEEFAVEAVLAGANDYVMKDNLKRVPIAVRREIHNKELQDQKREAEEKIRESLREKEVMLKEIHHRVKNNLAVISALLTLQADYAEDERSKELFLDSVSRIKSMALIHEKLYQSEMLANVSMGDYLNQLASSIADSYQREDCAVRINVSADECVMDITKAIPCGLIVNELLANAFKHAFSGMNDGHIHLKLEHNDKKKQYILQVKDDGVGMPSDVMNGRQNSLGFTIVKGLARQIAAEVEVDVDDGTEITLVFKSD